MKILSFNLLAWGPFAGKSLDFSAGRDGLHVIYGPNEAGKSSALRALRALLYGVEERPQDNFLHENSGLRIGARLGRADGTTLEFVRRKGRVKTVLDAGGAAMDDRALDPFLGNVSETLFTRFFGISHADLVEGGKDILTGKGGVGESLFAAAMGGGTLRRLLEVLDRETDEIYRPRGSKQSLNVALERYKELRKQIQELSVPGREWEEHDRRLNDLQRQRAALLSELGQARVALSRIERLERALPLAVDREERRRRRHEMGDVLLLPEGFTERHRQAEPGLRAAQEAHRRADAEITRILQDLERLQIPSALLREESRVTELYRSSGIQQKGSRDLPKRRAELQQVEADARNILADLRPDLSFEQVETLRIGLAAKSHLRELASNHAALSARQAAADRANVSLDERIAKVRAELESLGSPRNPQPLRSLLSRVQKQGDLAKVRAEAAARLESDSGRVQVELTQLPLGRGSLAQLEALAVPSDETIRRFETAVASAQKGLENLEAQIREKEERNARLTRDIESLEAESALPTEADLERARARREAGWSLVRTAWLEGRQDESAVRDYTAGLPLDRAYERSVAQADDVADRMRREAGRVAQKATWLADRERTVAESAAAKLEHDRHTGAIESLRREWNELWEPAGIDPLPPAEMREWTLQRRNLIEKAEQIRADAHALALIDAAMREYTSELSVMLAALGEPEPGIPESFTALVERSQRVAEHVETLERRRAEMCRSLAELESDRTSGEREAREGGEALERWRKDWAEAVADLGFGTELTPATVNGILDRLDNLFEKIGTAQNLRQRIDKMQADVADFTLQTSALVSAIAPDIVEMPPDKAAAELNERLSRAREDRARQAELQKQLRAEQEEMARAKLDIDKFESELKDLCHIARCEHPDQLVAIEGRSDRALKLDAEIEALNRQLAQHVAGGTVDDLIRETEQIDRDTLAAEKTRISASAERLEWEASELDQQIGQEKTELARVDGRRAAADAAESAQAVLAEIRTLAGRWLELRAAAALLRAGIEHYRIRSQGPLLRRVGEIFAALTLGSFAGLQTQYDENDQPVLAGLRPDGEEVRVEGMSDGTCDQLYLALRLASIERHLDSNEPFPFVLDDVLVHFDNERSRQTLRLLADLSRRTQVLFFTHHAHLVELATAAVPRDVLIVHTLEP